MRCGLGPADRCGRNEKRLRRLSGVSATAPSGAPCRWSLARGGGPWWRAAQLHIRWSRRGYGSAPLRCCAMPVSPSLARCFSTGRMYVPITRQRAQKGGGCARPGPFTWRLWHENLYPLRRARAPARLCLDPRPGFGTARSAQATAGRPAWHRPPRRRRCRLLLRGLVRELSGYRTAPQDVGSLRN